MRLFKGFNIVMSDYSLLGHHQHQGVPSGVRLCNSYTRECPHHWASTAGSSRVVSNEQLGNDNRRPSPIPITVTSHCVEAD
jgi:hypothetical protein